MDTASHDESTADSVVILNALRESPDLLHTEVVAGATSGGVTEAAKQEMLRAAASLANTDGGRVLIGVSQVGTEPDSAVAGAFDVSSAKRLITELQASLRQGIDPPLAGASVILGTLGGKGVLLVQLPRSTDHLHMVTRRFENRYYGRNQTGRYLLSADQIHRASTTRNSILARLEQWRLDRVDVIQSEALPFGLRSMPGRIVLHAMPMLQAPDLDLSDDDVWHAVSELKAPAGSHRRRTTFDGYLVMDTYNNAVESYSLWHYDRRMELVIAGLCWKESAFGSMNGPERWLVNPLNVQNQIIEMVKLGLESAARLGGTSPYALALSIIGLNDVAFRLEERWYGDTPMLIDRDRMLFPAIVVDVPPSDLSGDLLAWLDRWWQAGGRRSAPRSQSMHRRA